MPDAVIVTCYCLAMTPDAILVREPERESVWLPWSQVAPPVIAPSRDTLVPITVSRWMADLKGFTYASGV